MHYILGQSFHSLQATSERAAETKPSEGYAEAHVGDIDTADIIAEIQEVKG